MENKTNSGGVSFVGLLQLAFIVMKLCGVISWSWWWILSPTWIIAGILLLGIVAAVIIAIVEK